jgi:hypothetical protein
MLFVQREDYTAASSWRLLDWCRTRGADEFSLAFLGPPYLPDTVWAEWDVLLAPFRRRVASAGDRWALTGESAAVLEQLLPGGLLGGGSAEGDPAMAAVRDPAVYRGGSLLLSVDTMVGEGAFSLRHEDEVSLERAGLPFRRTGRVR